VALSSSFFGFSPSRSLRELFSLFFFSLTLPTFAYQYQKERGFWILFWLLAGQGLSAFQSLIDHAFPHLLPKRFLGTDFFPGMVTESGQLTLTSLIALAFVLGFSCSWLKIPNWSAISYCSSSDEKSNNHRDLALCCVSFFLSLSITIISFFKESVSSKIALLAVLLLLISFSIKKALSYLREEKFLAFYRIILLSSILPLMICTLLINLKRGPWLGIVAAILLLMIINFRRLAIPLLIIPLLAIVMACVLLISPIRDRLSNSYDDFFDRGGRSDLWNIALEFIQEYPLGIGFDNSRYLKDFTTRVPPELKHFHNNLLNITSEVGWLGLILFLSWIILILLRGLKDERSNSLSVAVACAVIAWQLAGVVEYNFGDSEVLIVAYMVIATLLMKRSSETLH
jgi:hypothetical protein